MNENNQNINNNLNQENVNEEKESNLKLILYIIIVIVIFIIILLLLKGCNALRNKSKNQIMSTSELAANMWNKCVDPIYWYTVDGTGVNGASINIDETLKACDTYYEESKNLKIDFDKIEDNEFKEAYDKVKNQTEIVYPKIKNTKIEKQVRVNFEEDMDLFYEYQVKLYELVKKKYSEGQ